MRGAWTGLAPQHRREELLCSALEGVAFTIREAADCLLGSGSDGGSQVPSCGWPGAARPHPDGARCWPTSSSAPLTPVDVPGASALGAALLAREAAGIPRPAPGPQPRTAQPATRPRPGRSRFHRERYERYRESVEALRLAAPAHRPLPGLPVVVTGPGP